MYRFVQLYTSRSYESRRSELVNPPDDSSSPNNNNGLHRNGSSDNLQQHVLSPRLVDAISRTAQVVWATTKKQEGLIGRSDILLQTAVGMPVAMDRNGNMCVAVMFSPNNVQSTDDAMEYLYSISQSATSASIPCLRPVFDPSALGGMKDLLTSSVSNHPLVPTSLGDGVIARFVSLDESRLATTTTTHSDGTEVHADHELSAAPKDKFGIPILPSLAELGHVTTGTEGLEEAFDEATYGIWTTIMENNDESLENLVGDAYISNQEIIQGTHIAPSLQSASTAVTTTTTVSLPPLKESRKERLVEFCSAFLGMSVFDLADVWAPSDANSPYPPDTLRHVVTVTSTDSADNQGLTQFQQVSERTLIKFWNGAVGRAFSTGNPVWSSNENMLIDSGRRSAFQQAHFRTVLAMPVISRTANRPACVVAAYACVKSESVPFVLRFVQQALRVLWDGLDRIDQPHVSTNVWENVAPADLGEMAADVEMQQHFHARKRTHQTMISSTEAMKAPPDVDSLSSSSILAKALSSQPQSIELPNGDVISIPIHLEQDGGSVPTTATPPPVEGRADDLRNHVNEALRSVAQAFPGARPSDPASSSARVNKNVSWPKRAHLIPGVQALPLAMPQPLPSHIIPGNTKSASARQSQATVASSSVPSPTGNLNGIVKGPAALATATAMSFSTTGTRNVMPAATDVMAAATATFLVPTAANVQVTTSATNVCTITGATNVLPIVATPASAQPEQSPSAFFCVPINSTANGSAFNIGSSPAVTGKICRIQGCGEVAVSRRPYCVKHSGNRQCEHSGCNKCAQGSTRFCIAHGGGRRCTYPGCDKGARDKFFCAAHGGGKRCQAAGGCTKSAVGGSRFCTSHGGGRRCDVPGCGKSAQSSTRFCVKHGGGKKCCHEGCDKVARGRTSFCAAHGGGIRCKLDGCNRVAIGKLQLCRAHGGGSSRGSDRNSQKVASDARTTTESETTQVGNSAVVENRGGNGTASI